MFFRRILVLSLVLPQLALGQVAVKPVTKNELLNRAALAQLRGYAIEQEMQSLGEAFAKDPGYEWDAKSLTKVKLTEQQRANVREFRYGIFALGVGSVGVGVSIIKCAIWSLRGQNGLYAIGSVFGMVGIALLGAGIFWPEFLPSLTEKDTRNVLSSLESLKVAVVNNALQDDLADYRVSLVGALFSLSKEKIRVLRDTIISELHRGNFALNSELLRKAAVKGECVLSDLQLTVFEKFQSDTTASIHNGDLTQEVSGNTLARDGISYLKKLNKEVEHRKLSLKSLLNLPRKTPGDLTMNELYQTHVKWSTELADLIIRLKSGLAAVEAQK